MEKSRTYHRRKIVAAFFLCLALFCGLTARVVYLMVFRSEHYAEMAEDLHQRERKIKARRGRILDRNGEVLADNRTVCTISVIHSQIREPEKVIAVLSEELEMEEEEIRRRVEKVSSIEKIKSNVEKEKGDAIRAYGLARIKVDEDYKRYYPWSDLASKVLGFTGADNQGILALESYYESWLEGEPGVILETTDARGVQIEGEGEKRIEPVSGDDLCISLDRNIQQYATQLAQQVKKAKEADSVSILVMRPDNGEILALADVPEYDLNDPFVLPEGENPATEEERQDLLNRMWRNACISDTYEPGSAFKIITASAALEEGVVTEEDTFQCPGYIVVDDRKIRCAKVQGHGTETFVQGTMNSCNPVFVTVGLRLGVDRYYRYFEQFGLKKKDRNRSAGGSGDDHAQKGKYGPGGAGHRFLRAVLSDHAHPARHHRVFADQRRKEDHPSFRIKDYRSGRKSDPYVYLAGGKGHRFRRYQQPDARDPVSGGGKRRRTKREGGRVSDRGQNGDQRDAAQRDGKIHFLFPRFCAGGGSESPRAVHHP